MICIKLSSSSKIFCGVQNARNLGGGREGDVLFNTKQNSGSIDENKKLNHVMYSLHPSNPISQKITGL